jgi:CspA family cold shock protein
MSTSSTTDVTSPQLTGRVKWFNNKAGFGFITVCDGEQSGNDIFVHFSSIQVKNQQYKYLVQGEYVNFSLTKPTTGDHEYHAVDVCGIKGGSLMCETRKQTFDERVTRTPKATRETTRETTREEVIADIKRKTTRKPAPAKAAAATTTETTATTGSDDGFKKVERKRSAKSTAPRTPRKPRAAGDGNVSAASAAK